MNITTSRTDSGIPILHIEGHVDSQAAQALETALWNLITGGTCRILVDLHGANYVSSGGLRAFLAAHKEVRKHPGGDLRLYGANDYVRKIFELAGLTDLMPLAPDLATAQMGL